jgi:hypothetical protein
VLALHHLGVGRSGAPTRLPVPPPGPAARSAGFTSPAEVARFASGMAEKGSSPEGIAWFLGGDS